MKKTTYKASPDIALVKYWGKKDEVLRLPENGSVSIIVGGLETTTTVEFQRDLNKDEVTIQGKKVTKELERVCKHLDRIRNLAGTSSFAKVVSQNNFPLSTGLSSSGSGFAALTLAATKAAGLELTQKELSILARQGSGSACRCVCGGYVEWLDGERSNSSYARTIHPASYWNLRDLVVVVNEGQKSTPSTKGHKTAKTSLFYSERQDKIDEKINQVKQAISNKNFVQLGELMEAETLEFHSILLTSVPPIIAWHPGTVEVMLAVQAMREEGVQAYFSISTGFNVHVLTTSNHEKLTLSRLKSLDSVKRVIGCSVGGEPKELNKHLF